MARFFVEVPHDPDRSSCARAVQDFFQSGSHFLTHADWGCQDGDHKAWLIIDVPGNKEDVRQIVPRTMRDDAKIVQLNRYTLQDIDAFNRPHES